ncbi:Transposable element Tc1 transposase, partial [Stegodyphus mimosarum]
MTPIQLRKCATQFSCCRSTVMRGCHCIMSELTDFERRQIVGARMVGASVSKVAEVFSVSRGTVSKIYSAYLKSGKTSSAKSQRGRKCVLSDRDRRSLRVIVTKNMKTTAEKGTAEMNAVLPNPVSTKTIRRELHKQGIAGSAAIVKPLISDANARNRKRWCLSHKAWTIEQWKRVIWSDESSFTLFPTSGRVYVWRTPSEAYNTDCLLPRVKHGGGSVMGDWGLGDTIANPGGHELSSTTF